MSCFEGKMKIYQEVSIDRFDSFNLHATAYFLSHCHSDHMIGLDSEVLHDRLKTNKSIKIYMSEVSKALLLEEKRFSFLRSHICALPIEEPKVSDDYVKFLVAYVLSMWLLYWCNWENNVYPPNLGCSCANRILSRLCDGVKKSLPAALDCKLNAIVITRASRLCLLVFTKQYVLHSIVISFFVIAHEVPGTMWRKCWYDIEKNELTSILSCSSGLYK